MRTDWPEPHIAVVHFTASRLDAYEAVNVRQDLLATIDAGAGAVVLDLKRVDFVDSSGIGMLVSILKRLGMAGTLVLLHVSQPVRATLALVQLDRIFSMADDEDAALALARGNIGP